ncbi:MAG: arginyltransferase [Kangiellaceae bacterium]|jgi:arginine-tRNA-protein transferase|nr:arginyltransferase [Kangiellaceae bacterium]
MLPDPNDELLDLTFYATPAHACSYLANKQATTVFLDPEKKISARLYNRLSETGFRRSGTHIYRPHCDSCQACIPVRVPVNEFTPNKNQRRCRKKGRDFHVEFCKAEFNPVHYALYHKYITLRHSDGDMFPPSEQQYQDFLFCKWADTEYLNIYQDNNLIACSVVDVLDNSLSAVYTFFDPDYDKFSLGRLAILHLIEQAKTRGMHFLYLGYLIKDCQKMKYKSEYRPIDCLIGNRWLKLN